MPISREFRRILFIRTDRIGDVLMNLPAIHLLRQTFPKAWIAVMLDASVAELLKNHPDIDEIIVISTGEFKKSFKCRAALTRKLKKIGFDLGIASNPDKFLHALLFFSGIRTRVGHDRKWPFFLNRKAEHKKDESPEHEINKNLRLIKLISDKEWDGAVDLPVDELAKRNVESFLKRENLLGTSLVAVHPGTSNPEKRWPEDRFAQVCDRIQSSQNLKVVLVGGEEERESSKKVSNAMQTRVVDWTGRLDLKELTALFHHLSLKLLLSSDSGPVHIAWMSGTPVVALYAKNTAGSDPERWGPLDPTSEVIFKPIQEISVDEVSSLVKKVLDKN